MDASSKHFSPEGLLHKSKMWIILGGYLEFAPNLPPWRPCSPVSPLRHVGVGRAMRFRASAARGVGVHSTPARRNADGATTSRCRVHMHMYCSFGQTKFRYCEIKLNGLQSWYIASLCHHNGAAKRNFHESPLWSSYRPSPPPPPRPTPSSPPSGTKRSCSVATPPAPRFQQISKKGRR